MMKIRLLTNKILVLAAAACLAWAYLRSGYWLIVPALLVMALFWFIMKKGSIFWTASSLLLIYIFLAGAGIVIHLSLLLMAVGATAALASWDLTHFRWSSVDDQQVETQASLERHHLHSLAIAASTGFVLALIASYANLQIPFGLIVLLVLAAVGCLTYTWQSLER